MPKSQQDPLYKESIIARLNMNDGGAQVYGIGIGMKNSKFALYRNYIVNLLHKIRR
jgi:hypothetical protein